MCTISDTGGVRFVAVLAVLVVIPTVGMAASVNVRDYLPASWPQDGSVDLRADIQAVLDAHDNVHFPGSGDPDNPLLYPVTTGLTVRAGNTMTADNSARLLRIPSSGHLLTLEDDAYLNGLIVDGNKYEHWPAFTELGKSDSAIRLSNQCLVEDCVVFNNPGIAFYTYGEYNQVLRCRAENVGYNDLKFGKTYYEGADDNYSGDGFYMRGYRNSVEDSKAVDCFRWDFTSPHSGAQENIFRNCVGQDVNWRTYGFIDFEGSDPGNRAIDCTSPDGRIVLAASPSVLISGCTAPAISIGELALTAADNATIFNCTTISGGIVLKGVNPQVRNNVMYKTHPGPADPFTSYSFYVESTDGNGNVQGNTLYEYDDGSQAGPGMSLVNVPESDNTVQFGLWNPPAVEQLELEYGWVDWIKVNGINVQAAYDFDQIAGDNRTVSDISGNAHDAVFNQDTILAGENGFGQPGSHNNSAVLDGSAGSYHQASLNNPGLLDFNETEYGIGRLGFTLEGWIYLNGYPSSGVGMFFTLGGSSPAATQLYLGVDDTGQARFRVYILGAGTDSEYGNAVIPLHTWTHVALTYKWKEVQVYVNGQLARRMLHDEIGVSGNPVRLDRIGPDAGQLNTAHIGSSVSGYIDDVRFSRGVRHPSDLGYHESFTQIPINTCQDVWMINSGLAGDLNQDCYVDLQDASLLFSQWLQCYDPTDEQCRSPWTLPEILP